MNEDYNIYDAIKNLAKKHGISIAELAERMGITRQTLNTSMKSPSYPTLIRLASAIGVPVWQLFVDPSDLYGDSFIAFMHISGKSHTPGTPREILEVLRDECPDKYCSDCIPFALDSIRTRYPAHHDIVTTADRLAELISLIEKPQQQ